MPAKLEHHWAQQRWRTFRCKFCMDDFQASRPDAEFCSAKCRQADRRLRIKAEQEFAELAKSSGMKAASRAHQVLSRDKATKAPPSSCSATTRSTTKKKGGKGR